MFAGADCHFAICAFIVPLLRRILLNLLSLILTQNEKEKILYLPQ